VSVGVEFKKKNVVSGVEGLVGDEAHLKCRKKPVAKKNRLIQKKINPGRVLSETVFPPSISDHPWT